MKKKAAKAIKEIEKILDIEDYLKYKNERDYILFLIGITTGYRAGDLVSLKVRDIKEAIRNNEFCILENKKKNTKNIKEKNKKPRIVSLNEKLKIILKQYIKDKKDYEYMFKSRKGNNEHIKVTTISRILKEAGEVFGLNNISAHSMRKTYAYMIYINNNKDIFIVKELLGHSSIEITKLYLEIEKELYTEYSKCLNRLIK